MKYIIFSLILITSCTTTSKESQTPIGYKSLHLMQSLDEIRPMMQEMEEAPAHVSAKRGEGFKEFKLMKEPSFNIEDIKFNPSMFMVFNPEEKLVSYKMFYVCEVMNDKFDADRIIQLLDGNQIKGLKSVYESKESKQQIGNDILKMVSVDTIRTGFPVVEYVAKYLP